MIWIYTLLPLVTSLNILLSWHFCAFVRKITAHNNAKEHNAWESTILKNIFFVYIVSRVCISGLISIVMFAADSLIWRQWCHKCGKKCWICLDTDNFGLVRMHKILRTLIYLSVPLYENYSALVKWTLMTWLKWNIMTSSRKSTLCDIF